MFSPAAAMAAAFRAAAMIVRRPLPVDRKTESEEGRMTLRKHKEEIRFNRYEDMKKVVSMGLLIICLCSIGCGAGKSQAQQDAGGKSETPAPRKQPEVKQAPAPKTLEQELAGGSGPQFGLEEKTFTVSHWQVFGSGKILLLHAKEGGSYRFSSGGETPLGELLGIRSLSELKGKQYKVSGYPDFYVGKDGKGRPQFAVEKVLNGSNP